MHIKNFLYAAPHRELPDFLALNGGKVKKKVGKYVVNGDLGILYLVGQAFVYKIANGIR